jgi:hypothetical protein
MKIRVHSRPYPGIMIDGVQLDKELITARNTTPTREDFELCVEFRKMNKDVLNHVDEIIAEIKKRQEKGEENYTFYIN